MKVLPMGKLKSAIGIYKTTLAVYSDLADEDYSPALDKATLSFLEELKEYRGYGTVEEFKHYKLGDCMNDCEHYENCANYICSKGYNKAVDEFAEMVIAELQKAKHEIKLNENDLDIYRGAMICAIEIVKDSKGKLQS